MRIIILAAGKGVRMKSRSPKVLHPVCGKPMLLWVIEAVQGLSERVCVVLGHSAEQVKQVLPSHVEVRIQNEQLGTAHAVMSAQDFINPDEDVMILYGDMPLLKKETLMKVVDQHKNDENCVTIISTTMADPTGYGRIVRDSAGKFLKIVEETEAMMRKK